MKCKQVFRFEPSMKYTNTLRIELPRDPESTRKEKKVYEVIV